MPTLDIFTQDAFGVVSMTDAINKIPYVPGRAGQVIDWQESGVSTTVIWLEEKHGRLQLLNPTPRGGPGETTEKRKRTARTLSIPHYQHDDAIYADEVQGVRAFGSETETEMVQAKVNERQTEHVNLILDPTLEYQRIGALKGLILNADGSTLYNLYNEFGVTKLADVSFDFSKALSVGSVRGTCDAVVRMIATQLGGISYRGIVGFCGDAFWDALIASKETRETYLNQAEAAQLREGTVYQTLRFGGIMFENYRGGIGNPEDDDVPMTPFIASEECNFFPVGVPGLWRTVNAPADYIETVNTLGLPRYSKQFRMDNDKGIRLESQANSLSYNTRPRTLITGDIASD